MAESWAMDKDMGGNRTAFARTLLTRAGRQMP